MRYVIAVLALIGVILSSMTLWIHYSPGAREVVPKSSWNSSFVNHSSYAVVDGIPVAVFGIFGYAGLALLARFGHRILTAIASMLGLAYALYLTNVEAHVLNVWCVFCLGSLMVMDLITLLAFGQLVFESATPER